MVQTASAVLSFHPLLLAPNAFRARAFLEVGLIAFTPLEFVTAAFSCPFTPFVASIILSGHQDSFHNQFESFRKVFQ